MNEVRSHSGDCTIPTAVRYNSAGRAIQFGIEAVENIDGLDNTTLVQAFKLFLHPMTMRVQNYLTPSPLRCGVALKTVYSDILAYIFNHARQFVDSSSFNPVGRGSLWARLKSNFVVIMPIPNGWGDSQQAFLRQAVVAAGILPFNHDHERLQFVSEPEAAIHFAISTRSIGSELHVGSTLAVCNAGDSMVETTAHQCTSAAPTLQLREITAGECVQAGSASVDEAVRVFLERKFANSRYGTPEIIESMVIEFERKAVGSTCPRCSRIGFADTGF